MMTEKCVIGRLSFYEGTMDHLVECIVSVHPPTFVCTVNLDFLALADRDANFCAALLQADIRTVDGVGVSLLRRLHGFPSVPRVTGADLLPAIAQRLAAHDGRLYILGAGESARTAAATRLMRMYPGLAVSGYSPTRAELDGWDPSIAARILEFQPRVVAVALGAPLQEVWIARHRHELPNVTCIGVGAAVDFLAGTQRRAPSWLQRSGCEWLWRLIHDPKRLWSRYIGRDVPFLCGEARCAVRGLRGDGAL